jgi:hypothetical protein
VKIRSLILPVGFLLTLTVAGPQIPAQHPVGARDGSVVLDEDGFGQVNLAEGYWRIIFAPWGTAGTMYR